MQFKIIIITGIFLFLISSLSIANPISKNEIPPQKTEQTQKQKPNFFQKIILKRIQKKVAKKDRIKHKPSKLAITSTVLGTVSYFVGVFAFFIIFRMSVGIALMLGGVALALGAIITGAIAPREENGKRYKLAKLGIGLGIAYLLVLLSGFLVLLSAPNGW